MISSMVKDVPDALNTPSIYATYQYIGQPDQQVKRCIYPSIKPNQTGNKILIYFHN